MAPARPPQLPWPDAILAEVSMDKTICRGVLAAALVSTSLISTPLLAAAPPPTPDPADPQAAVPATVWRSALSRFRPGNDADARNWREANDEVTRIGGWRTYLREAHAPEPPAQDAVGAPPKPPAGHGGHGHHGNHAPGGRKP